MAHRGDEATPPLRSPTRHPGQLTDLSADLSGLYKPIIFIGGAPGTGKSTLANLLLSRLDLDHRIGTGFVRAILQSEASPEGEPQLFSSTFESENPAARVVWQAHRMRPAVAACVDRARREGTSLVVEGSHLLPSVYADMAVDAFVVLAAPSEEEHARRIGGHRHAHRTIEAAGILRIRQIDDLYRRDAGLAGVPVLAADAPLDELVEALVALIPL